MSGAELIAAAVDAVDFGRPTAARRGRNPAYPWVPIIDHGPQATGVHTTRTVQIPARAFATRDEAVAYAADHIDRVRGALAADLANPRYRALRRAHGLPEAVAS